MRVVKIAHELTFPANTFRSILTLYTDPYDMQPICACKSGHLAF